MGESEPLHIDLNVPEAQFGRIETICKQIQVWTLTRPGALQPVALWLFIRVQYIKKLNNVFDIVYKQTSLRNLTIR